MPVGGVDGHATGLEADLLLDPTAGGRAARGGVAGAARDLPGASGENGTRQHCCGKQADDALHDRSRRCGWPTGRKCRPATLPARS